MNWLNVLFFVLTSRPCPVCSQNPDGCGDCPLCGGEGVVPLGSASSFARGKPSGLEVL